MTRPDPYRGTGRTTKQIQAAPLNCHFICPPNYLPYTRALAHELGRDDIKFIGHHVLQDPMQLVGSRNIIIVDHAIRLDLKQQINIKVINSRICPAPAPAQKVK